MDPLSLISSEARAHRTVLIAAVEADGSMEQREIEPYSLRPGAAGKPPVLKAFCLKKQGTRSFTITNIVSAQATGRPFQPRWVVEL